MNNMLKKLGTFCLALGCALILTPDALAQRDLDIKAEAVKYLANREPDLQKATDDFERTQLLLHLAPAALSAGELEKASKYALEMLSLDKTHQQVYSRADGDSVHAANIVLGRIALMAGDVGKAKEHLLAAGKVPGSAVLNSFGPNMLLAKELIEKGERATVIEYFDLCAKFWKSSRGRLDKWRSIVARGGVPDFGPALAYWLTTWRLT